MPLPRGNIDDTVLTNVGPITRGNPQENPTRHTLIQTRLTSTNLCRNRIKRPNTSLHRAVTDSPEISFFKPSFSDLCDLQRWGNPQEGRFPVVTSKARKLKADWIKFTYGARGLFNHSDCYSGSTVLMQCLRKRGGSARVSSAMKNHDEPKIEPDCDGAESNTGSDSSQYEGDLKGRNGRVFVGVAPRDSINWWKDAIVSIKQRWWAKFQKRTWIFVSTVLYHKTSREKSKTWQISTKDELFP